MSHGLAAALGRCFETVYVYRPAKDIPAEGLPEASGRNPVKLRIPVQGDEKALAACITEYQNWGHTHRADRGMKAAAFNRSEALSPFFDETSISRIRSDIKQYQRGDTIRQKVDPLFSARLFLGLAQAFDVHSQALNESMALFQQKEKAMMDGLKGEINALEAEFAPKSPEAEADSGAYLTEARLDAWGRLFLADAEQIKKTPAGLFITHSPEVVAQVQEKASGLEKQFTMPIVGPDCRSDDAARKQQKLDQYLDAMAAADDPAGMDRFETTPAQSESAQLTIFCLAGVDPVAFVAQWTDIDRLTVKKQLDALPLKNTLLGLIRI